VNAVNDSPASGDHPAMRYAPPRLTAKTAAQIVSLLTYASMLAVAAIALLA